MVMEWNPSVTLLALRLSNFDAFPFLLSKHQIIHQHDN
jgi:hypothetical protein